MEDLAGAGWILLSKEGNRRKNDCQSYSFFLTAPENAGVVKCFQCNSNTGQGIANGSLAQAQVENRYQRW